MSGFYLGYYTKFTIDITSLMFTTYFVILANTVFDWIFRTEFSRPSRSFHVRFLLVLLLFNFF